MEENVNRQSHLEFVLQTNPKTVWRSHVCANTTDVQLLSVSLTMFQFY